MSLRRRLDRLEERQRGGRCPECGLAPKDKGYIVLIDEGRPEESIKGDPDERCQHCGRRLWFTIEVSAPRDEAREGSSSTPGEYQWP